MRARAGAGTLALLAAPLNVQVLRALTESERPLVELRRKVGAPATTMRVHLRDLSKWGVVEQGREAGFPGRAVCRLTDSGRELAGVSAGFDKWLLGAPYGDANLAMGEGNAALKAFVEAWHSGIVRVLAGSPLTLTDLSKLITALSYPSLERRLAALRLSGLIESTSGSKPGTPYVPSAWMRRAVGPLTAAIAWERKHHRQATAPLGRLDIEAAFLLAVPLLKAPDEATGSCKLIAEVPSSNGRRLAGVRADVAAGSVVSCVARLESETTAWASGSGLEWLAAVLEGRTEGLELGGDTRLTKHLIEALRDALGTPHSRSPS